MKIQSFNHVSLVVADMDRAITFYSEVLGLRVLDISMRDSGFSEKATGIRGVTLKIAYLAVADFKLELVEYIHDTKVFQRGSDDETFGHICLNVQGLKEFYELHKSTIRFVSKPRRIPGGPNKDGYMLYFYDPDDNKIELIDPP